jgi:hypothetical protein
MTLPFHLTTSRNGKAETGIEFVSTLQSTI